MSDQEQRFTQLIRDARRALGLNQQDVAVALRVRQPSVSAWENGKAVPAPEQFQPLAELLQLDPEELREAAGRCPRCGAGELQPAAVS